MGYPVGDNGFVDLGYQVIDTETDLEVDGSAAGAVAGPFGLSGSPVSVGLPRMI